MKIFYRLFLCISSAFRLFHRTTTAILYIRFNGQRVFDQAAIAYAMWRSYRLSSFT